MFQKCSWPLNAELLSLQEAAIHRKYLHIAYVCSQFMNSSLLVPAAPRAARERQSCFVVLRICMTSHSSPENVCVWFCPLMCDSGLVVLGGLSQKEIHWGRRTATSNRTWSEWSHPKWCSVLSSNVGERNPEMQAVYCILVASGPHFASQTGKGCVALINLFLSFSSESIIADKVMFKLAKLRVVGLIVMYFLSAYCKNSVDGQWYCFDDSDVQQLSENEVCKQTAYILFYQRRTAIPSWSANSSVAGKPCWHCQGVVLISFMDSLPFWRIFCPALLKPPLSVPELSKACLNLLLCIRGCGKIPPLLLRLVVAKRLWRWGSPPPSPWVVLLRAALVKTMT